MIFRSINLSNHCRSWEISWDLSSGLLSTIGGAVYLGYGLKRPELRLTKGKI